MIKYFYFILLSIVAFNFISCSGKKIDENNPQELLNDAEEDIKDKRYLMALDKMKSLKNKFPYSHLAITAQLRIADIYYAEESYIEAAGSYETFRDLHPKHEKADYVTFQIGESYYNQLPSSEDRDMTAATKAIDAYQELLSLYPRSLFETTARQHLTETNERLSEKEKYIADFYYKRSMYDSAARRYEKITAKFQHTSHVQYAYWRWGQALIKQNKQAEAKQVFRAYLRHFPSGAYAETMHDWLNEMGATIK